MSHYDQICGYRYADEILSGANSLEVLITGQKDWQRDTANQLRNSALDRIVRGINVDYQRGIMARVEEVLK